MDSQLLDIVSVRVEGDSLVGTMDDDSMVSLGQLVASDRVKKYLNSVLSKAATYSLLDIKFDPEDDTIALSFPDDDDWIFLSFEPDPTPDQLASIKNVFEHLFNTSNPHIVVRATGDDSTICAFEYVAGKRVFEVTFRDGSKVSASLPMSDWSNRSEATFVFADLLIGERVSSLVMLVGA